ncbi:MAG: DNA topoisomerase IB [Gemmatimonadaceae bacterium]
MAEKWICRKGSKSGGFQYSAPNGKRIRDKKVLERIDTLRIPPAWREVHIAVSPRASIQAWGLDARGRKQYRYHPRAVQKGEMRKFYRVAQMGRDLPLLRKEFHADLRRKDFSAERVAAGIVLLIGEAFIRVGSEKYEKENNTFGITTLGKSHATVENDVVTFKYVGKRSISHRTVVTNAKLARLVESLLLTPGARLFRYQKEGEGDWLNMDARDVNEYIEKATTFPYTAKDFRTWGGTLRAATVLSEIGSGKNENSRKKDVTMTVRLVASELGNTPTILRKSYVHPAILARYLKNGARIQLPSGKGTRTSPTAHTADEKALIAFLNEHAPERRKERREE